MGKGKSKNSKIRILFFGTPKFGDAVLNGLIENNYKPVSVIANPDKAVGRSKELTSPPTKILAQKYNIPVFQPVKLKDSSVIQKIKDISPDLIVVAAYGKIIPKEILDIPKYGSLNVHASILPRWRGASPIQFAILNGDKNTGVTIMLMDEEMDHGPILTQKEIKISAKETVASLHDKLADLGTKLLLKTIPDWISGKIKPAKQEENETTYTKILTKEDGKIIWAKNAEDIERQIRAFSNWPTSFCFWKKNKELLRIKILEANFNNQNKNELAYGKVFLTENKELAVNCGEGYLVIKILQLEGKKAMSQEEFLKGNPDVIGTVLE